MEIRGSALGYSCTHLVPCGSALGYPHVPTEYHLPRHIPADSNSGQKDTKQTTEAAKRATKRSRPDVSGVRKFPGGFGEFGKFPDASEAATRDVPFGESSSRARAMNASITSRPRALR